MGILPIHMIGSDDYLHGIDIQRSTKGDEKSVRHSSGGCISEIEGRRSVLLSIFPLTFCANIERDPSRRLFHCYGLHVL